ncbi:putative U4/U6 small nuclear ribonucleoprotein [Xylariales sp. PMI_506]|nr:putative U4/U6 small nuclear ribonucleoprotein [Xylariales sp. PMI_506]
MDRHGSPGLGPRHDASSRVQKPEAAADKLAALKARVAAAIGSSQAKGGLNVGLHPALADVGTASSWKPPTKSTNDSRQPRRHDTSKPPAPSKTKHKQLDLSGPSIDELKSNPYYDANLQGAKPRQSRQLIFNQKGKFIQQGQALRRQAQLEALKKKIAAQTKKVGIDDDIDVEKSYAVEEPPACEWWDEGLLDASNYDSPKIDTSDSIITMYIQHPVAIEPAQDKLTTDLKPMYLTTQEQKKLRRMRRLAERKEVQAKQRLGLLPPEPPKVKLGNLMRVIGGEAVQDPTAVENRVRREIQERHDKHLEANEERKLTKEQRHEKLSANQEKDSAKGLHLLVFKVNSLANGQHRYKISVNAEQLALTGMCIMHPKFSLVIVEGGGYSIRKFRKLMLDRINWAENAASRDKEGKSEALRQWLMAEDESGQLKDMSLNKCTLVFDGEVKSRGFKKWGSRVCETDTEAREILARAKMDNFWNLAKSTT